MNIKIAIAKKINLKDYDSVKVGDYIETEVGEFICQSKPNIYQPIDSRYWVFMQTAGTDGEPIMSGKSYTFKS